MVLSLRVTRHVHSIPWMLAVLVLLPCASLAAQGTITGTVTRAGTGEPLAGVQVAVRDAGRSAVTGTDGRYTLQRVPTGTHTLTFLWLGFRPAERSVTVTDGGTVTVDASLEAAPVIIGDIVVNTASRAPERVVEAPAAVSTVPTQVLDNSSLTAQAPLALATVPGLDVAQSGVNDFSVNARGFNSSLNRRVLVLQDGRDLAIAFLGAQEWNGLAVPLEDMGGIEVVRGPGSALYGANAFSGVVNMRSQLAREIIGTKVTLGGGELETIRGDVRHAGLASGGRFGYRLNAGYNQSDTWTRSRTNPGDLAEEYDPATDEPVPPAVTPEAIPLSGQTLDPVTREAIGDRDPIRNIYGSARLDFYRDNGGVVTAEGGMAQVENEVLVTGIGRVQVLKATKPYARVAWAEDRFNLMAYWNGRSTGEPQKSLASGLDILEESAIFHVEGQANHQVGPARLVVGSSFRNINTNTSGTLMDLANDDRSDNMYSAFGQVEVEVHPMVKLVGAARVDDGDLFDREFSPKAAVVVSPNENHSFRVTFNRAFQTPNYSEFFLRAPAGAPANFTMLELGLRASPLGPALAGVPVGQLYTNSASVPVLALGNANLEVEHVTGWEAGYKANLGDRAFVTVDVYLNDLEDFVTDLLPGVNPAYGAWTAPPEVPEQFRAAVEQATRDQLAAAGQTVAAAGLTRVGGNTAIVVSYANAGEVRERGIEVGVGYSLTNEVRVDASFTGFDFEIQSQATGDQLVPNTPSKKASFMVSYMGPQGIDANVGLRLIDGYAWAAGVFQGYVPAAELLSVGAGYRVNNNLRVHATATNLLDQQRFQLYGGSVIGRRVLAGITANF